MSVVIDSPGVRPVWSVCGVLAEFHSLSTPASMFSKIDKYCSYFALAVTLCISVFYTTIVLYLSFNNLFGILPGWKGASKQNHFFIRLPQFNGRAGECILKHCQSKHASTAIELYMYSVKAPPSANDIKKYLTCMA